MTISDQKTREHHSKGARGEDPDAVEIFLTLFQTCPKFSLAPPQTAKTSYDPDFSKELFFMP